MKTLISKLVIASVLSLALIVVTEAVPHLSQKYNSYRSARVAQTQSGTEIPGSSYAEMMNVFFASPGR